MKICGIYKITSPSKKVYIGQSIDIVRRFWHYKKLYCEKQFALYNSLKKYGVEKHKFDIVCQCDRTELNNLEIYYIELYQCFNSEYGLNLRTGGKQNIICSDETRKKLSDSCRGKTAWNKGLTKENNERLKLNGEKHSLKMKGRKASEETKKKMSDMRKGKNNSFYGKHHSEEQKQKISNSKIGKKLPPFTDEHKRKIGISNSIANKGHISFRKGLKGCYSKETIQKMSDAKKGCTPWNKGISIKNKIKS